MIFKVVCKLYPKAQTDNLDFCSLRYKCDSTVNINISSLKNKRSSNVLGKLNINFLITFTHRLEEKSGGSPRKILGF